ncbi:MAG: ABC transporter permease [Chitinivibrionales bacterium]|nr:ABC transporter permease [Chitinivibrionales bacterium]
MLRFLIEKEFKQIRRHPFLPKFIIVFPFIALWILPMAANFEIKNVRLSVLDNSHSTYSQRLIQKIVSSGYFKLTTVSPNYSHALRAVELDNADIVLEIPAGFENDFVREKAATVMVSANTVNGTRGGLGSAFLAAVITDFGNELRAQWSQPTTGSSVAASFQIVPQYRYNPHLRYPVFMVPAIMVMLMAMICGFLPALNIVNEKERGTMEQMNVTPVRRFTFILSKLIPFWIMGFVVLTICFGVARFFYGLIPVGSMLTIYLFASVFVLAFSGFGLVISNFAKSIQQAMFMMFFFVVTFIFMSGLYTPVASMPHWAQTISIFSPLKYFILVMRSVYLKGSSFHELMNPFCALCGFALFFNLLAVLSYHKKS